MDSSILSSHGLWSSLTAARFNTAKVSNQPSCSWCMAWPQMGFESDPTSASTNYPCCSTRLSSRSCYTSNRRALRLGLTVMEPWRWLRRLAEDVGWHGWTYHHGHHISILWRQRWATSSRSSVPYFSQHAPMVDCSQLRWHPMRPAHVSERFVARRVADTYRGEHTYLKSPWELNVSVRPTVGRLVPWGTAGYAYVPEQLGRAWGAPKYRRSEPVLMLGNQNLYTNVYKCLTQHHTIIKTEQVSWDVDAPKGE